jgi:hypothetical protein
MKVIALDISTHTGWAIFEDSRLTDYGTYEHNRTIQDYGDYPRNYCYYARDYVARFRSFFERKFGINAFHDVHIVIEETTSSRNSLSQKILEYLHFCFIQSLPVTYISYIRTGSWRTAVGAVQTREERNLNARIARIKKKTGQKLAKIDGKVVGKKTRKDSAIRTVREIFGIELKKKDNNTADAILLGLGYLKGAEICDGTIGKKKTVKETEASQ